MRTTIEDVAREAGVSIATVSRYVNGHRDAIAPTTQARVQEAIERLSYRPDLAARSLKTGKTGLIGVILSNIAHPYWSTVLAGVEEACQRAGYCAIVSSASDKYEIENRYLHLFLNHRVDGLLLNPAVADPAMVAAWSTLRCPVVALDRTLPGLPFDLVAMDNLFGARLAIEHLLALGHQRIGFVSWEIQDLSNREERLRGYQDAMEAAGHRNDDRLVRFARDGWQDGVLQAISLLEQTPRPTAIFSASALLNLQILVSIKQSGLRVPEDVSVVGYDESPWDPLLDPPLTTVATPARRLGVVATERLLGLVCGTSDEDSREVRLKPELIVRASTAQAGAPRGKRR
jgi:DNA-binding LacI/PurR family transcriptional regulator